MKKKIGIVIADYPLGVLLDTVSMVRTLAQEDFLVDIFIDRYMYESAKVDFAEKNVRILAIPMSFKRAGGFLSKRVFGFTIGAALDTIAAKVTAQKNAQIHKVRAFTRRVKAHINEDYVCLIGVEPRGLIAATWAAEGLGIPVIYQNMELLLENECKTQEEKAMKQLERECSQKCLFVTVQDARRAQYLIDDNRLDPKKIQLLPNSLLEKPWRQKTGYLYEKLGIPKEKTIVLYAGNINRPSMSLEIARAAKTWDEKYVLVLHTWAKLSPKDEYANALKRLIDNKKIYLSTEFLENSQFPPLISSAAIGLVFYQNLGPNYYEIGSACNKLVRYVNAGVPAITIDFPSLREKIEPARAGICVASPELIGSAIEKIMHDYQAYRDGAFRLYEEDFDFSKNFKPILESIKKLA